MFSFLQELDIHLVTPDLWPTWKSQKTLFSYLYKYDRSKFGWNAPSYDYPKILQVHLHDNWPKIYWHLTFDLQIDTGHQSLQSSFQHQDCTWFGWHYFSRSQVIVKAQRNFQKIYTGFWIFIDLWPLTFKYLSPKPYRFIHLTTLNQVWLTYL